jgi:hypothetical protein
MCAHAHTLRLGDPHAAAAVIDDALTHGLSSIEIHSRVIAPAMQGFGEHCRSATSPSLRST